MKAQSNIALALLAINAVIGSSVAKHGVGRRTFAVQNAKIGKAKYLNRSLSVRGGDLGPIASETLAKVYSGLVSLDAISGTLAASKCCEIAGMKVEDGSLAHSCVQAMGGVAANLAITSYLAVTGKTTVKEAIGYGMLGRLLFLVRTMLDNNKLASSGSPYIPVKSLAYAALIYGLLSDKYDAMPFVKVVVGATLLQSLSGYFRPVKTANAIFGVNMEKEGELTTQTYKMACGYDFVGCLFMLMLARGVDPVQAVGKSAAVVAVWILDLTVIDRMQDLCTADWMSQELFLVAVLLMGCIAGGILL